MGSSENKEKIQAGRFVVGRLLMVVVLACVLLFVASVSAEWRIDIESKTVWPGATDVTVTFTMYSDLAIYQLTIPCVVREVSDPPIGAFWTGQLPVDTTQQGGVPYGVDWTWGGPPPWPSFYQALRPTSGCATPGNQYDCISPDNFFLVGKGVSDTEPAHPDGHDFVTIHFDVTDVIGQFEFDTACATESLNKIFLIGIDYRDHGPGPNPDFVFNKGVITIDPCDCGEVWGDFNGDGRINPVDNHWLVVYVYLGIDLFTQPPNCPYSMGDVNCDGKVNPVDMVLMLTYVYLDNLTPLPCVNPCEE